MVLVDTSVWVDHLRGTNPRLKALLEKGEVVCHPLVIGELACGNISRREEILALLRSLPGAVVAVHEEAMRFLEAHRLMGIGLGFVDVHLLASSRLTQASLWTLDHSLGNAAEKLGAGFSPSG
ncbi:MAG: ribonuclease [Candidatus Aminicenantes bacterium RBG_13_62_12]|nr:MAG: ribonuclease [Candidatus Aminicenantes bacterium RBG_13_62_12]